MKKNLSADCALCECQTAASTVWEKLTKFSKFLTGEQDCKISSGVCPEGYFLSPMGLLPMQNHRTFYHCFPNLAVTA